jgi:hypothetical protein
LRLGRLDAACRQRAEELGFYTIGESFGATNPAPGEARVFESRGISLLSVRGPDGQSYVPGWPSPGGSFAYLPAEPNRLVVPLARLVRSALDTERGLVLGLPSPYISLTFQQLAACWGRGLES